MNRAIIMGRLVATPELRQTTSGISVSSFTVAVNRRYTSRDGERQADFIDEGTIQTRTYEDKQGNKRKAVELVADQAYFCESKNSSGNGGNGAKAFGAEPSFNEPEKGASFSIGDFGEFEEVDTDDSELPF